MTAVLGLLLAASLLATRWGGCRRAIVAGSALLAIVHVLRFLRGAVELRWTWHLAALSAWPLWGAIQLAAGLTIDPAATRAATLDWCGYAIIFFLALQVRADVSAYIAAFAVLFAGASITVLRMDPGTDPAFGPFWNRNHYAAWVELMLPITLYRLVRTGHAAFGVATLGLVVSMLLTRSRLGIALAVVEVALVMLLSLKRKGPALAIAVVLAMAGLAAGWQRFAQLGEFRAYESRLESLQATTAMIAERPVTGWGLGAWQSAYPRFAPTDIGFTVLHADNDWFEWMAEAGVALPVMTLLPILFATARAAYTRPDLAGPLAVAIHALGEFPLHKPALMEWSLALIAIGLAAPSCRPIRTGVEDGSSRMDEGELAGG